MGAMNDLRVIGGVLLRQTRMAKPVGCGGGDAAQSSPGRFDFLVAVFHHPHDIHKTAFSFSVNLRVS